MDDVQLQSNKQIWKLSIEKRSSKIGRLMVIHLQCWEVLLFLDNSVPAVCKILCPGDPESYTPLALNRQNSQYLPALAPNFEQHLCCHSRQLGVDILLWNYLATGDLRYSISCSDCVCNDLRHAGRQPCCSSRRSCWTNSSGEKRSVSSTTSRLS